jgi:hypothetical protein
MPAPSLILAAGVQSQHCGVFACARLPRLNAANREHGAHPAGSLLRVLGRTSRIFGRLFCHMPSAQLK